MRRLERERLRVEVPGCYRVAPGERLDSFGGEAAVLAGFGDGDEAPAAEVGYGGGGGAGPVAAEQEPAPDCGSVVVDARPVIREAPRRVRRVERELLGVEMAGGYRIAAGQRLDSFGGEPAVLARFGDGDESSAAEIQPSRSRRSDTNPTRWLSSWSRRTGTALGGHVRLPEAKDSVKRFPRSSRMVAPP